MNKVTIVGRLGQDPELSTSQSGKSFVKFSLATNDGYGDNKKTNWHNCVAFGKVAEIINQYTSRGSELAVNGTLDYNKHEDKTYASILVNDFTFIGGKPQSSSGQNINQAANAIDQAFEPAGDLNEEDNSDMPF